VHEVGHWLGLGHPCEDAQETRCLGDDVACPFGFACVLGARDGVAPAPGVCRRFSGAFLPAAASCENDAQCGEHRCAQAAPVGRTVCRQRCEAAADCPLGYACADEVCVGATAGTPCPAADDDELGPCGCEGNLGQAPSAVSLALVVAALALALARVEQTRPRTGGHSAAHIV
jgi:hypothetical protein